MKGTSWRTLSLFSVLSVVATACSSVPEATRAAIPGLIAPITAQACEAELALLLELGPRYSLDPDETEAALAHIEQRMQSWGYETFRQPAGEFADVPVFNLVAEIRGASRPQEVVELGAHYDTVSGTVGADDNGSGVAGVLQVAQALRQHRPERTVRFVFFGCEEYGLTGSRNHVENFAQREDQEVLGLLNLEMIGFTSHEEDSQDAPIRIPVIASLPYTANFILVVGNVNSGGLGNIYEGCIRRYVPDLPYYSANRIGGFFSDAARSDHANYWDAGIPGVMISDTSEFRNPHYHRSSDRLDTIDFDFMSKVTRAAAATMVEWGGLASESVQ